MSGRFQRRDACHRCTTRTLRQPCRQVLYSEPEPVHYLYANRLLRRWLCTCFSLGTLPLMPGVIHDMHGNLAELCSNFYTAHIIGGTDPNDQSLPHSRASRHNELPVAEPPAVLRSISMRLTETSMRHSGQIHRHATHPSTRRNAHPFQGENHRLSGKMKMPSLLKYCLPIASCLWLSTHCSGDIP